MDEGKRTAGRPRSAEKETAILRAALALLASQGYARMTLDQVASTAGVSKSTIFLRWKTKADLLTAALESVRMVNAPALTRDVRSDLIAILEDFAATVERVRGMALIGTCLAEEAHNPDLLAFLRQRTVLPRRALLHTVLEQARDNGLVHPDADLDAAVSALLGPYYADYMARSNSRPGWASKAVDLVLAGLRPVKEPCRSRTPPADGQEDPHQRSAGASTLSSRREPPHRQPLGGSEV